MSSRVPARRHQSGAVMIYMLGAMLTFVGICSFAVDYGRVQVAKTQLRAAADAAALAAAGSLRNGPAAARSQAVQFAVANLPAELQKTAGVHVKVTFGYWGDPQDLV